MWWMWQGWWESAVYSCLYRDDDAMDGGDDDDDDDDDDAIALR